MLAYVNLATFSLLTIREVDWDDTAVYYVTRASIILAYVFFFLAILMPIIFFVHYCRYRSKWTTDLNFKKKYGTFLAGFKNSKQEHIQ